MNNPAPPTALIVVLFVLSFLVFLVGWFTISLAVARFGGWQRLSAFFPANGQPSGKRFRFTSGKIGKARYNNCLTIHSAEKGIYLSVLFIFRLGHPPIFIPWEAMRNSSIQRFLWLESVTFEVDSPCLAKIELPKRVFGQRLPKPKAS